MIVGNLHLAGRIPPDKADAPLLIDADTVLPRPIASQFFQSIAGRQMQIPQFHGAIEDLNLAFGLSLERLESFWTFPLGKRPGVLAFETLDHMAIV